MKRIFRYLILLIFIFVAMYFFLNIRYKNTTFILIYHKIDYYRGGYKSLSVNPKTFDKQMNYLYKRGYKTIKLQELTGIISGRKTIPDKVFILTFDDGYENNYTNAFPILKKYDFIGTAFLTAGYIGKSFAYPNQIPEKHLSIKQIKNISEYFDFGSHSITHPSFVEISREKVLYELVESRKIINKIVDKPVNLFAYPFGDYNTETKDLVKNTNYIAACTANPGLVDINTDLYELPRFEFKELNAMSIKDFFRNIDLYIKTFFCI